MDLALFNGWLDEVYRSGVLGYRRWKGLEKDGTISTTARYNTGTVDATNGSASISGTSTVWTSAMTGREIRIGGRNELYTFTYVSGTSGTLDRVYEGDTDTELAYEIVQRFYNLASDVEQVVDNLLDPESARPLTRTTQGELDEWAPHRPESGEPFLWAPAPDSAEVDSSGDTAVSHRVELYPIPTSAEAIPYRYTKRVTGFTGTNTSGEPLPWVTDEVLMEGVREKALRHDKDYTGAGYAAAAFQRALKSLSDSESRRIGPVTLQMARRYTQHRAHRWNSSPKNMGD